MKGLTLYRPWTWSIVHGPKRIENRPWKRASILGQRIALHSGKTFDKEAADFIAAQMGLMGLPAQCRDEGIVGVATVTGFLDWEDNTHQPAEDQAVWFFGPFGWVLDDVRPLKQPIPYKGSLGLWAVPVDVERLILAQL